MTQPYVFPDFEIRAFNCPYCGAFSRQLWSKLYTYVSVSNPLVAWSKKLAFALCEHCGEASIWLNSSIIWPATVIAPKAHIDMPQDVAKDYEEARHVLARSPRSSTALLRLCVQKLCVVLGEKGEDINADIGSLVSKGLPLMIQQALDIVRVVGNEQVHPGTLDVRDNPEIAQKLFQLVNFIVEDQISKPKLLTNLYQQLPAAKRDGIEKRDKPKVKP
jgi:hypothetical protein